MNGMTASTGRAVVVGTMGAEALTALYDLRWMLVLSTSGFREPGGERATRLLTM